MILDVTTGCKSIYNGWNDCDSDSWVGIDTRRGDFSYKKPNDWSKHQIIIKPTILATMAYLPFRDKTFVAIIFDPPYPAAPWFKIQYGCWKKTERIKTLFSANEEFRRVLVAGGLLILKVMATDFGKYQQMLTNFKFILPIFTYRLRGSYKKPLEKRDGALWTIGIKK